MTLTVRLASLGLVTLLLAACQTSSDSQALQEPVLSVYATRDDARAVASGQFGSVPLTLEFEKALVPVTGAPCDPLVIQVRTAKGQVGWAVQGSFTKPPCVSALDPQSSSACNCTSR